MPRNALAIDDAPAHDPPAMDEPRIWGLIAFALAFLLVARVASTWWHGRASSDADTSPLAPGRGAGVGRCEHCGYDLRGTPTQCPECGAPVPPHRRPLDPARLRDDWPLTPIEPRRPRDDESPVLVWDAPNQAAAALLADQFAARGVRAVARDRTHAVRVGAYETSQTYFAVYVWTDDVEAAHAIMARLAPDA